MVDKSPGGKWNPVGKGHLMGKMEWDKSHTIQIGSISQ